MLLPLLSHASYMYSITSRWWTRGKPTLSFVCNGTGNQHMRCMVPRRKKEPEEREKVNRAVIYREMGSNWYHSCCWRLLHVVCSNSSVIVDTGHQNIDKNQWDQEFFMAKCKCCLKCTTLRQFSQLLWTSLNFQGNSNHLSRRSFGQCCHWPMKFETGLSCWPTRQIHLYLSPVHVSYFSH